MIRSPFQRFLRPVAGSLAFASSLALLAGCGGGGAPGAAHLPAASLRGTTGDPAGAAPSGPSTLAGGPSTSSGGVARIAKATDPTLPAGVVGIQVYANADRWPASSFVLSTNRNHVAGGVEANLPAKLDALKALRPSWGQGRYMYRIGHGVTDGRFDNSSFTGYHFQQEWDQKGNYPYDDIRNALNEADTLDAEQLHVVNFGTGTPDEAASYVSYLNNPSDANRAQHPEAVQHAKFFEIGNEISWSMERGHDTYAANETAYATRAKQFAQAMRAASPDGIQIGAVASTNSAWNGDGWSGGATQVKNILQTMGNDVDFLIFHGYPSWPLKQAGNFQTYMAQNAWNQKKLDTEIRPAIAQYASHPVWIANTEFFTENYDDKTMQRSMGEAMYSADSVILAMNEDIRIANQFCFSHGDQGDSSFFVNDNPAQTTPVYKFQQLLAKHWGDEIVKTAGQAIPTEHVQGANDSIDMPALSYTAARGKDGHLYVMVLNRTNDQDVSAQLALGFTPGNVTAYTLGGPSGWTSDWSSTTTTSAAADLGKPYGFKHATVTLFDVTP